MFIDYFHLSSCQAFETPDFKEKLVVDYHRYEPYLRKAVT